MSGWRRAVMAVVLVAAALGAVPAGAAVGDLDPSFSGGVVLAPPGQAYALAVQPDGKIVVAGSRQVFPLTSFPTDALLARYNENGTLDPTFGAGGMVALDTGGVDDRNVYSNESFEDVAVDPDGKIVVVGTVDRHVIVARYNANGAPDQGFNGASPTPGVIISDLGIAGSAVVLQGSRIVVGATVVTPISANLGQADFALARYDAAGALDPSFGSGGTVTTNIITTASPPPDPPTLSNDFLSDLVLDDGDIVAGGTAVKGTESRFGLARYSADGAPDTGFGGDGTVKTAIRSGANLAALAVQGGEVVAAGVSNDVPGGTPAVTVVRYTDLGALNPSFGDAGKLVTQVGVASRANGLAVDPAGRLLVAGLTAATDPDLDDSDALLLRLGPNGELDTTFSGDGAAITDYGSLSDEAQAVAVQAGRPVTAGRDEVNVALARYQATDAGPADVSVSATAGRDPVTAGEEVTVTVTATNNGPSPAGSVRVAGPVPADGDILTVTASEGSCTHDAAGFACVEDGLEPGAAVQVTLFLLALSEGRLEQSASVTSASDPTPGNDHTSVSVRVDAAVGRWDPAGDLPSGERSGHTATLLGNGKVLVVGGLATDGTAQVSADLYDPGAGTWVPAAPMPPPGRTGHTATVLPSGRVLVAGGLTSAGADLLTPNADNLASSVLYDPATNTWATGPDMNRARGRHTATPLGDGRVLVAGGFVNEFELPGACQSPVPGAAEIFDPAAGGGAGAWTATAPRRFATVDHTANALPDGRVLVVGGYRGSRYQFPSLCADDPVGQIATAEIFNPADGSWTEGPAPAIDRRGHTASSLPDGRVLVAGGTPCGSGDCVVNDVEIFDPALRKWSPGRSMLTARAYAGATVLPSGKVLVTGGQTPSDIRLGRGIGHDTPLRASAETFDPTDGRWRSAGAMSTARQDHTSTVLALGPTAACGERCGRVLVTGGEGDAGKVRSAEVYTPVPEVTGIAPAFGPPEGGTVVTVKGNGLAGATAVRFGAVAASSFVVESSQTITAVAPPQPAGVVTISVTTPGGTSAAAAAKFSYGSGGYWLVAADGGVFAFGSAPFRGSTGALRLNAPIVGMAPTPSGTGYWLVAADGGVFSFGGAPFRGSTGALRLNKPVVGMAATLTGNGYWLVAADGGVFAFGDAVFRGSTGALRLNAPVVGMASTPSGKGYWLVASDGGVFAFGDAPFRGSTGALRLNKPIVGMAATSSGDGYRLVASDGGIFAFGDSTFHGSTGALRLNAPVVGMAATPFGRGYWLVASDGGVFAFGDASFRGSTGSVRLARPMVGMAAARP
ncbi:MAG TPA: kelch repeat-containing protein [Acidimicrobiales bacterium]|nr:kelch repeat-containing protein [Acidimicrobiales bacterium]